MIRYDITRAKLLELIDANDQKAKRKTAWTRRSAAALKKFLKRPAAKLPALWSEVKPVYARLQCGKCAFCERLLGQDELIAYEQDVEHFRPKKGVDPWPPSQPIGSSPYPHDIPRSSATGKGYRQLPFHELNYIVACKTCNTRCKANFFPVAEKHDFNAKDPIGLATKEKPYLVYPLGTFDEDPERLLTFNGYVATAAADPATNQYAYDRGRVMIAFFLLNDPAREDQLLLARATQLDLLGTKIESFEKAPKKKDREAQWRDVLREGSPRNPHANCIRSLIRLYAQDPTAAKLAIEEARELRRTYLDMEKWAKANASPPS